MTARRPARAPLTRWAESDDDAYASFAQNQPCKCLASKIFSQEAECSSIPVSLLNVIENVYSNMQSL